MSDKILKDTIPPLDYVGNDDLAMGRRKLEMMSLSSPHAVPAVKFPDTEVDVCGPGHTGLVLQITGMLASVDDDETCGETASRIVEVAKAYFLAKFRETHVVMTHAELKKHDREIERLIDESIRCGPI